MSIQLLQPWVGSVYNRLRREVPAPQQDLNDLSCTFRRIQTDLADEEFFQLYQVSMELFKVKYSQRNNVNMSSLVVHTMALMFTGRTGVSPRSRLGYHFKIGMIPVSVHTVMPIIVPRTYYVVLYAAYNDIIMADQTIPKGSFMLVTKEHITNAIEYIAEFHSILPQRSVGSAERFGMTMSFR